MPLLPVSHKDTQAVCFIFAQYQSHLRLTSVTLPSHSWQNISCIHPTLLASPSLLSLSSSPHFTPPSPSQHATSLQSHFPLTTLFRAPQPTPSTYPMPFPPLFHLRPSHLRPNAAEIALSKSSNQCSAFRSILPQSHRLPPRPSTA